MCVCVCVCVCASVCVIVCIIVCVCVHLYVCVCVCACVCVSVYVCVCMCMCVCICVCHVCVCLCLCACVCVCMCVVLCLFDLWQLRNKASNLCVDTRYKGSNERFQLETCVKDGGSGGEQVDPKCRPSDWSSHFNLLQLVSLCFCFFCLHSSVSQFLAIVISPTGQVSFSFPLCFHFSLSLFLSVFISSTSPSLFLSMFPFPCFCFSLPPLFCHPWDFKIQELTYSSTFS